ncbi:hypothetical protein L0M97_13495, partial [[Ruminococcus] torques]|uniref:hypothetical protein n=1 Tax=[Ruminococcus] torques TaxID=33039 RepID=UPI001EE01547
ITVRKHLSERSRQLVPACVEWFSNAAIARKNRVRIDCLRSDLACRLFIERMLGRYFAAARRMRRA